MLRQLITHIMLALNKNPIDTNLQAYKQLSVNELANP